MVIMVSTFSISLGVTGLALTCSFKTIFLIRREGRTTVFDLTRNNEQPKI